MKKIRLGLIGCGGMMKHHATGIQELDCVEITAVCDVEKEKAEDVATVLNSPYVTTDYTTMVNLVDAVLVVLPHHLHFPCGMFFARHKKHILMEKPLCNTEEECLKLIETCEENDITLMCAYPVRYWGGVTKLKELIDSNEYGRIMQMSIWTEQLTICNETDWLGTSCIGGGQFFSHGCHYIDILLWFCGNPVSGAHFGTNVGTPWMLREGTSAATIKFENGSIGYHAGTWGAHGTRLGCDFQIMAEKAMLEYDACSGEVRIYDNVKEHVPGQTPKEDRDYKVVWRHENMIGKQTQNEVMHFVDCVLNKKKPDTDGRSALESLRVIWKMYDAEKAGTLADLRGIGFDK